VFGFEFQNTNYSVKWKWGGKGKYTTKSVYDYLTKDDMGCSFTHIWKAKIPYKIKIFTWLLENNAVLTKDNMKKRKWAGDPSCMFCPQYESLEHLFFQCPMVKCVWGIVGACLGSRRVPGNVDQFKRWMSAILTNGKHVHHFGFAAVCWAIWKCRNKAVFDKK
jgi:hypothetical protein